MEKHIRLRINRERNDPVSTQLIVYDRHDCY